MRSCHRVPRRRPRHPPTQHGALTRNPLSDLVTILISGTELKGLAMTLKLSGSVVKAGIGIAAITFVAAGLGACSSNSSSGASSSESAPSTPYTPGTKATAQSHPPNPVISKMTYKTAKGKTTVTVPVTTVAGSSKDTATATVVVYPNLNSRERPPKPIYTASAPLETGDNKQVVLPISDAALKVIRKSTPAVGDQLLAVSISQKVDGDGDGNPEGTLNARSSYHDSLVKKAGETVNLTIGSSVTGPVNLVTTPVLCMYNDSSSDFAALNTTLSGAGQFISSSIEADGDIGSSPQYGGPPWSTIASELATDVTVDGLRALLGALEPVSIAYQAIIDFIFTVVDDCESQASIFSVQASSQQTGGLTSQAYVASEQTSNGLLTAQTAASWQANAQESQGGTVWQASVTTPYLQQAAAGSVDSGLSIAATNQHVGWFTLSSDWTFMINQGGTSSIPNGCDDKGC